MSDVDGAGLTPDAVCDGGDTGCGGGLLTMIVQQMKRLRPGQVLEIRSTDAGVREDLPAWCRMVGHKLVAGQLGPERNRYLVRKGA
jgi:TusA-related sulfurtransferase